MSGPGAVVALVLLEWSTGLLAGGAWSQSWTVVRRGHFRIVGWTATALGVLAGIATYATGAVDAPLARALVVATAGVALAYVAVQYSRTDVPGIVVGAAGGIVGAVALIAVAGSIGGWHQAVAGVQLVVGAVLLGGVTSGMLLGHWYLNQPGLAPRALARLTDATLIGLGASAALGLVSAAALSGASTEGAVLGLPGFGDSFGVVFYVVWLVLTAFTAGVVWAARRCVQTRSIQSATGLYYVALLTAGVAEFLVRYLMVNAA